MDDEQFWEIIGLFDWSTPDDPLAVMESATDKLAELGIAAIEEFEEILAQKLYALDTEQHAEHTADSDGYVSADGFLYDRCYAVARGQSFYQNVLNDPAQMHPFSTQPPEDLAFDSEPLLYLTAIAAEQIGIIDFERVTQVSYETGSNHDGWKNDKIVR